MADQVLSFNATLQSGATATGNGTALNCGGLAAVGVQVEGITTGTVTFEGTIDGSTWYAVRVYKPADGSVATTATADGLFVAPVAGMDQFRARISAYTAGTITVTAKGTVAAPAWLTA